MRTSTITKAVMDDVVTGSAASSKRVHYALLACSVVMLAFCVVAAPPGALHAATPAIETVLLLTPPLLVPAAFLHEKKAWARRDAILMLPWTLVISLLITQVAPTTSTFAYPLRDELWRTADQHLGISIPAIMALAHRHPSIQSLLFYAYAFALHPLLLCAIFAPALVGRREAAQRFVLTNAFSFVLALPIMLFFPAVGPWVGWHFPPDKLQQSCEATIYSLRHGSLFVKDNFGGTVCLPSFHVFWAAVAAYALISFRYLRYPAILAAVLISISTMTTGWHYGVDVIAGLAMMVICTCLANSIIYANIRLPLVHRPGQGKTIACEAPEISNTPSQICE
jgi:membrane-associated phospholipid phosphatase